jgi:hypothetical protein
LGMTERPPFDAGTRDTKSPLPHQGIDASYLHDSSKQPLSD